MKYHITTWDSEKQAFTPQKGVPEYAEGLAELRAAIQLLKSMGYSATKDDPSVSITRSLRMSDLADKIKAKHAANRPTAAAATVPLETLVPPVRRKKQPQPIIERLPDKAFFQVLYNAAEQHWSGCLTIQGGPVFQGQKSGVFPLLRFLDQCYREYLNQKPEDTP